MHSYTHDKPVQYLIEHSALVVRTRTQSIEKRVEQCRLNTY
jgi:hypothetical protein